MSQVCETSTPHGSPSVRTCASPSAEISSFPEAISQECETSTQPGSASVRTCTSPPVEPQPKLQDGAAADLLTCPECPSTFTQKKNLYQHMRRKHRVLPELVGGRVLCPLECQAKFHNHKQLREHLETDHHETIESETLDFVDYDTFEKWKATLEASGFSYVKRISEKILQRGVGKAYLICHRSGSYKSKSTGKRTVKTESSKIGTTCPSVMEVSRHLENGTVQVVFWKTHLGHGLLPDKAPRRTGTRTRNLKDAVPFEVCAVIPAAGTGERMGAGGDTPKQYMPIHQKPLICYTAEAFLRLPFIKKVVVVAAADKLELMLHTLSQMCALEGDKLMVTEGYDTRHESIRSGLRALQTCCKTPPLVVVVHDGVRPFFSEDVLCSVILAAKEHGAAGITCPLVSTVISTDAEGFLDCALDRSKYKASEMPQAFIFELLCKVYEECSDHDLKFGTECLQLVKKYADIRAKLIPSNHQLWKVTHHKDIYTATAVVKESQTVAIISSHSTTSLSNDLEKFLKQTFKSVKFVAKLVETNIIKFPNLVQFHEDNTPYHLIEKLRLVAKRQKLTQLTTMVHVFTNAFDDTLNFFEFQKQAKTCAKPLKFVNILVYFVLYTESSKAFEELAELVRSLLFDSNPSISGNVFLS